jgi:hypothetical protein
MAICLGLWLPITASAASPLLRCEINQGGETYIADFLPTPDPYTVEAKDINGHFRFKAVVLGNEEFIESIRIYTYYREYHQVVLLHEARYAPPFNRNEGSPASLTGVNYLYSPSVEQELQYSCGLVQPSP